ncbi:hypothetical protein OG612_44910 (plasmid) [Streptomyces sp. NBC_01527]|uniref:hypothetical protein n=1 Tax=Streptomyces sp. NBC_01527 TaxID=2903894 RepID=UPI002F906B31
MRLIADHLWWTALIAVGAVTTLILLVKLLSFLFGVGTYAYVGSDEDDASTAAPGEGPDPDLLAFKREQLAAMSGTGFEQACADLRARGFAVHGGCAAPTPSGWTSPVTMTM